MEMDDSTLGISTEERERIVRGFEAWLDRAIKDESAPQGLTAELITALRNGDPVPSLQAAQPGAGGSDLYSLWAAMIALTQEVRIQGRTFRQLNETLLNETLPQIARSLEISAAAAVSRSAEDAPHEQGSARTLQPRKQEIDILLDLRDRIERGGNTVRTAAEELVSTRLPRLNRLARWLGLGRSHARHIQEVLAALSRGYSLTLDSLDEALVACRVSRVAAEGRIFDPQCMTAVDIEETESVPEGTVVEVYRNGFEWNNEVYRTAQVKVARAAK